MSWPALALVSDAELGQLEPEATAGDSPWGGVTWPNQRAEAKRDLRIWLELDFPEIVGVADRVLDVWPADYVFGYTSAAYADRTSEARNDTESDLPLAAILATPASDRIYLGAAWTFDGLLAVLTGTKNAAASVLTVKYSGPSGWTTLTSTHGINDGTASGGATFAQSGRITWTAPTNWQRQRLNGTGDEFFWVELSVSNALTSGVTATQLAAIRPPDGLKRCAAYLTLGHIYNGLAAQAADPERWRNQSDKYFAMAKDLYTGLKGRSALWIDLDHSGTVDPPVETTVGIGGHVFYRA